jgi:hypothetical protein
MATPAAAPLDPQVSGQSSKAVSRYQDGYRVARSINGLGQLCKIVGLITGIFVVFFGVMGSETVMRPNPSMFGVADYQTQHNMFLISVVFFGALVAFTGWVIGVVVAGYGQHVKATLDGAVNSSPFLSDSQRAQIMRLL